MSDALIKLGKTVVASLERSWLIINNLQFKISNSNKLKYQCFAYTYEQDEEEDEEGDEEEDYDNESQEANTQSSALKEVWENKQTMWIIICLISL